MMFGHDDQQQDTSMAPMPDGNLGQDAQAAMPPSNDVPSAPSASSSDSAGEFMMDDRHSADLSGSSSGAPGVPSTSASTDDDLLNIKQQALQQLSPLLGHLDQSPEEKFRTTMMLIQASDNDKLIPQAYEAAKAINDEKARAQALLDVVNEINYFTQQSGNSNEQ